MGRKKAKRVPCYICKMPVIAKDRRAISKLCKKHDTPENREKLQHIPIKELMEIYYKFIRIEPKIIKVEEEQKRSKEINYNSEVSPTNEYGEVL